MMSINETPPPSETPAVPPEAPPPPQPPQKISRKALYSAIGLIAIIAVASVIALMYLMPTGEAATIPLGMNYSEGESMTYNLTMTMTVSALGASYTQTATATIQMEVLSFDGTNYTIRYTMEMYSPTYSHFSYTVTMNKTGHILNYTDLPSEFQETYSLLAGMPGYGTYFPKEEMKVGESFQIPINMTTAGINIVGTLRYGISGIANITFPNIGLCNVFKMDFSATNVQAAATYDSTTINVVLNMNGYIYMEYGTCLPIEFSIQETATTSYQGQTMSMNLNMQMRLVQHSKP